MLILGEKRKEMIKEFGKVKIYDFCYGGNKDLFQDFDFMYIENEKNLESDIYDTIISNTTTFLPLWKKSFYLYGKDIDKKMFCRYIFEENRIQYISKNVEGLLLLGIFHLWNLDEISDLELIQIAKNVDVNANDLINLLNNIKGQDYDIVEKKVYNYLTNS